MEDLHFMERLERVSGRHVEMALGLYRDPDLVRFVLSQVSAPEVERVAISLEDPLEGPFVIVTREGRFVTCLGSGMRPGDLPIVTRQRLDRLGDKHLELRTRLAFCESALADGGAIRRLVRAMSTRAHRVTRETMTTLVMLAPLLEGALLRHLIDVGDAIREFLPRSGALVRRTGRHSARELDMLEAFWTDLWTMGHLVVLLHSLDREALDRRVTRFEAEDQKTGGVGTIVTALGMPFWPVQARTLWASARLGKRIVPALKHCMTECAALEPEGLSFALSLAMVAYAHPKHRAEIAKALYVGNPQAVTKTTDAWRSVASEWVAVPDIDLLRNNARLRLFVRGTSGAGQPTPTAEEVAELMGSAAGRDRLYRGRCQLLNQFLHVQDKGCDRGLIFAILPDLALLEPEDFYWSEVDLPQQERAWVPRNSLDILATGLRLPGVSDCNEPVVKAATPGRNDPCSCGSGKKYKRCCAA